MERHQHTSTGRRRWRARLAATLTCIAACSPARLEGTAVAERTPTQTASSPSEHRTPPLAELPLDDDLEEAVHRALLEDGPVDAQQVLVGVTRGVVTLTGDVESLLTVERASEIAGAIRGVRAVVSRLDVARSSHSDARVARDVRRALAFDAATDAYSVQVSVHEGRVRLEGEVASWAERDLAEEVASGVVGVLAVDNALEVPSALRPSDEQLAAEARARLRMDARVDDRGIRVSAHDGVLSLEGAVGSLQEKAWAARIAGVMGARAVSSKLVVDATQRSNFRHPGEEILALTPAEIERSIQDAWTLDPRVSSLGLQARVRDHQATLTGGVDNLAAREAAEQDARNTAGVWRTYDFIAVEADPRVSDDQLRRDVMQRLATDPYLHADALDVVVDDGRVSLVGVVDAPFDRRHARQVVARANGVVDVDDSIEIRQAREGKLDWEIEQDLAHALRWSPTLASAKVRFDADHGVVTLEGAVHDLRDYVEALHAAYHAGAQSVQSAGLHVQVGPRELIEPTGRS